MKSEQNKLLYKPKESLWSYEEGATIKNRSPRLGVVAHVYNPSIKIVEGLYVQADLSLHSEALSLNQYVKTTKDVGYLGVKSCILQDLKHITI